MHPHARWFVVSVTTSVLVLAAVPAIAQPSARAKSRAWTAVDCVTFEVPTSAGDGIECGYVTVPRRHEDPTGPTIQLATIVLPALATPRLPDPLFMAQGGPGGSTIDAYGGQLAIGPQHRPTINR